MLKKPKWGPHAKNCMVGASKYVRRHGHGAS